MTSRDNHLGQDLWERITSHDGLQRAWEKVSANEGSSGGDGVSLGAFRSDLFANLTDLRADLLTGIYRSGPFRKVSIPKKKPGYRILTIPSVRDRVVHTSIARVLTPILEPMFEDGSFGYRPNRGVKRAVERIEHWRKRGFDVVIEADIVGYFDNVDHEILISKVRAALTALPGSAATIGLIERLLADQGNALGNPGRGLAQGSPLSPLLANLYLDALDEEIDAQGVKIVRFADDFVILCKSEKKAEKALERCGAVLAEHGLQIHDDGTRIVSFDRGFDFIGYLFLRTLAVKKTADPSEPPRGKPVKSTVTDEGIIVFDDAGSRFSPNQRILYVLDPEHDLDIRNRSFSVRRDEGTELIAIPHKRLWRIEVGPGVTFSQRVVELAVDTGVEFALVDGFGQTKGTVVPRRPKRAGVQMAQAAAVLDQAFRLGIACALADARIRNQRTQLMRLNRTRKQDAVERALTAMKRNLRKLPGVTDIAGVFGVEGATSALYWPALAATCDPIQSDVFRRTRPARDPLNAAINYMTAILERDIRAAIHTVGLHPGFAFLHGSRNNHDGLVFDLMEPFRAPLVEGLAVYLFNARRLRTEMFDTEASSRTEISDDGRRAIIAGYETAAAKRVNKTGEVGKLGWRSMMVFQARELVRATEAGQPGLFQPYLMEA